MKLLKSKFPIRLFGKTYVVDMLLGAYASSLRPSIVLVENLSDVEEAYASETIAVATLNPPVGVLTGYTKDCFAVKNFSENEGLWPQLERLRTPDGMPYFSEVMNRYGTPLKIMTGFVTVPIYGLTEAALPLFEELLDELHKDKFTDAVTLSKGKD